MIASLFFASIHLHATDVGACQKIIDGKIKVKNGSSIIRIAEHSVHFADNSKLEADIIILATG